MNFLKRILSGEQSLLNESLQKKVDSQAIIIAALEAQLKKLKETKQTEINKVNSFWKSQVRNLKHEQYGAKPKVVVQK